MEKFDANTKMRELIDFLNYHQDLYDAGTPIISDKEWDETYIKLKVLEAQFPNLYFEDSPTHKIRYTVVNELKKVKHEYQPMLSLDKTKDIEEIKSFIDNRDWIAMLKLDGLTCRLTYEDGKLVRAETRGNGIEGEDITHNAMVIPNIPKKILYTDTLVVDGEVVCDKTTFEQFKDEYANCRNFAAGSIRLLDSQECAKRGLSFIAWDAIKEAKQNSSFSYSHLSAKLEALWHLGFECTGWFTAEDNISIEQAIEELQKISCDRGLPIDGIVFKWDDCKEYEAAGRTEHHFRGGMAYKFYDEEYETELLDIEWSMGRTGVLTPVAVYKDVEIDGATCNRANLHNLNILAETLCQNELGAPYKGQRIWVYKANAIIPQISRADVNFPVEMKGWISVPQPFCPICFGDTEVRTSDSGTRELYCSNPQCPGKLVNVLDHFCGKKGLDIKGLSKATLEKLIDWGWVTRAMDLFYLYQREHEWINKPGFGAKSVKKILDAIEEARHTTLEKYLSAISIPLIGKTYARQLAQIYEDYNTFREVILQGEDFSQLEGFGPAMHEAIMTFDYAEADRMVDMNIIDFIEEESELEKSGKSLEGKTFCVTGKVHHWKNRDELSAAVIAAGGKITSSVSSKTDYLVNNNITSTSSKNLKAKELNIPIITEEELLSMLN